MCFLSAFPLTVWEFPRFRCSAVTEVMWESKKLKITKKAHLAPWWKAMVTMDEHDRWGEKRKKQSKMRVNEGEDSERTLSATTTACASWHWTRNRGMRETEQSTSGKMQKSRTQSCHLHTNPPGTSFYTSAPPERGLELLSCIWTHLQITFRRSFCFKYQLYDFPRGCWKHSSAYL